MNESVLNVQMLGGFTLTWHGQSINDSSNRMRKVWLLLAYLICHRKEHITQEQYFALFRGKNADDADPANTIKAMFFRVRNMLEQLEEGAGHHFIARQSGTYVWNGNVTVTLDAEEFDLLCQQGRAATSDEERLALYQQALTLYQGDFLPKLSSEEWVMPLNAYYHRLYLETAEATLTMLCNQERWNEALALSEKALAIEPYSETLCCFKMRCYLAIGEREAAITVYEDMSELLFSTFGVMPGDESHRLYRLALSAADNPSMPTEVLLEQLRENTKTNGAFFCEYDFFRLLYQVQARAIARSGDTVHLAFLSANAKTDKTLARRSLERAMENLKEQLLSNLRQGDVVTQCSANQYILLLPHANYENSCMVCQRLLKAFYRQYPHTPIDVRFNVHPLDPTGFERNLF